MKIIKGVAVYFGDLIRVHSDDGDITEGIFTGWNYDYDDDGNEYIEFDIDTADGWGIDFDDRYVDRVEIIKESDNRNK